MPCRLKLHRAIDLRNCRATLEKSNSDADPTSFMTGERINFPQSISQVKDVKTLGDLPLTVITTQSLYTVGLWGYECRPFASTLDPLHQKNNRDFLTLSTQSKEVVSESANDGSILNYFRGEVTTEVKELLEE
jgi:hypothetical protein